jgi:RNA 2',3'-cyclic 3'-phosphodiesterase
MARPTVAEGDDREARAGMGDPPTPGEDRGPSARRFVAVPVAPAVRAGLEPVVGRGRAHADELSWTRAEGWHLTLAFLGRVEDARLGEVVTAVQAGVGEVGAVGRVGGAGSGADVGGVGVPRLVLRAPGRFGPRVLWVGVAEDPDGWLRALGARVQVAIAAAGLPVERRPVRPHLTLARGGRGRPVRDRHLEAMREALAEAPEVAGSSWEVAEVQVWRTELTRGPARYHVEAAVPLTG